MKKTVIIFLSLLIIALVSWKIYDYKINRSEYSTGIYESDLNYIRNTNSSADRFITTLTEQLIENPDNSKTLTKLGAAYIQKARESNDPEFYSLAEDVLKRAINNQNDNFLAMAELGSVNLSRHNFKEALVLSQKALELNPYNSYSYGVLVDAQIELGMYDEAIENVQKMVNLRPDLSSYSRVSYIRELKGDLQGAVDAMKLAVTAGSPEAENTAWCRVQLGNLFYNKGDVETAEKIYQFAIKDYPDYVHGYGGMAKIRLFQNNYHESIEYYNKALEKNSLPEYLIGLGDVYTLKEDKVKAEEQYQKVKFMITMFKEKGVDTDLELALFNADHDRNLKESYNDAGKSLENGSKSIKNYHILAWTSFKLGNFEEAEKNILEALRLGTKDPLMYYHAGKIYEKTGNKEKAKEFLDFALKINPFYSKLYADDQSKPE
ncbi:MAG TPA: tetratricopeptide repeat protein [Ignavibacteria bacterium]|nr:tetratricopeptide repeat protein [Ignavibacteria bacterium]